MKRLLICVTLSAAIFSSCNKKKKEDPVVSQQFIHKYGYAVTKEEWNTHNYGGQVITHMRDGVTASQTYDSGILDGPSTFTFADSEVISAYRLYSKGDLVKEIFYDPSGMPASQKTILSPTRYQLISWYKEGTPRAIEEFVQEELLEGQYLTKNNDQEARIEKGSGLRITRDAEGLLLAKEVVEHGYTTEKETFFPSGNLASSARYLAGKLQGEKKTFSMTGEPVAVEEYVGGELHGKTTHYRNGTKCAEISYLNGHKNGLEKHFLDGEEVSYQVLWENDKKHGPEQYYTQNGPVTTHYYYNGDQVSQRRYEELAELDDMIAQISP